MSKSAKAFLTKLDELNVIMLESYYSAKQKKQVIEDLHDLLVEAYLLGIEHVSEDVGRVIIVGPEQEPGEKTGKVITVKMEKLEAAVNREIDGETFEDRAERHIRAEDTRALQTLAETEYHRVFNEATADGAVEYTRQTGKAVSKTWRTMRDDRVRETHIDLEGQRVPINEWFYANDGDQALFPGGFANPENNVNCRCWLDVERVNA